MIERWKIVLSCLCAVAAVGLASGTGYLMRVDGQLLVAEASQKSLQTFYGFYGDMQADGTTKVNIETLQLRLAADSPEVVGESVGSTKFGEKTIQRKWKISGFVSPPRLVLNILTVPSAQDPKPPTGIGTYYLSKVGDKVYTGTAIYLDCEHQEVVQCPYALTAEKTGVDEARTTWSNLFKRQCEPIDLSPDRQHAALSC